MKNILSILILGATLLIPSIARADVPDVGDSGTLWIDAKNQACVSTESQLDILSDAIDKQDHGLLDKAMENGGVILFMGEQARVLAVRKAFWSITRIHIRILNGMEVGTECWAFNGDHFFR